MNPRLRRVTALQRLLTQPARSLKRLLGLGNGGKMVGKWRENGDLQPLSWEYMGIYGTGWWLTYPSEKYEFVSWDDSSQYMGK